MHNPTDRIAHTTAFVTPVVEHWLEREIAQWVQPMKDRSDDPSHHERTLLPRSYISLRWFLNALLFRVVCEGVCVCGGGGGGLGVTMAEHSRHSLRHTDIYNFKAATAAACRSELVWAEESVPYLLPPSGTTSQAN